MAWFGEGLSTLKGQLTNFTKEVLAEGRSDIPGDTSQFAASQSKLEELETLCASQELEISRLKDQNASLLGRLEEYEVPLPDQGGQNGSTDSWWSVQHWNLPKPINGDNVTNKDGAKEPTEDLQRKLVQSEHLVEQLQRQCLQEKERCEVLQQQVKKLSSEVIDAMTYKEKWQVGVDKVKELEVELQNVQLQLLEQVSISQACTSELREELELTRKHLLREPSNDRLEFLRGKQDMINHIIQISRKSREAQLEADKLRDVGKQLTEDVTEIVEKLGDPEEQEIIHGALKALELENQVLKIRNAQLEEAFKGQGLATTLENSSSLEENTREDMILKNYAENAPKMQAGWFEENQIMENNATELHEKIKEMEKNLSELEKEKRTTEAELEAMTAVVQDLEMQLSASKEETAAITTSLEELDQQHQDAINQLLVVKKSLQDDKDQLLQELKLANQKADVITTESQTDNEVLESLLHDKVTKLLTFEVSEELLSSRMKACELGKGSQLVEALVKMCAECKWQRDTLERKVACLMKELRECCEERDTLAVLSQGSSGALPSIPENSEEVEVLTQKILALEEKVAALTESRSNLETDAERLRDESNRLTNMLQAAEESLRNERNLNTEATMKLINQISSLQEEVASVQARLQIADQDRLLLEASFCETKDKLNHELQVNTECKLMLQESEAKNLSLQHELDQVSGKMFPQLLGDIDCLRQDYAELQNKYSEKVDALHELESRKSDVELEAEGLKEQLSNLLQQIADTNRACDDFKSLVDVKGKEVEVLKVSLNESQMESREIKNILEGLQSSYEALENELKEVLGHKTRIEDELKETHDKIVGQEKTIVDLKGNLASIDQDREQLKSVVALLEAKCSQLQQEREEWKERSLALQQQLEETLTEKAILEEDCKWLVELEKSVCDQHALQQEVASLSEELDSTKHQLHKSQECSHLLERRVEVLQQQFIKQSEHVSHLDKAITVASEQLEAEKQLRLQLEGECSHHQQMLAQANNEAAKWRQSCEGAIAELEKSKEVAQNRTGIEAIAGTNCEVELQWKKTTNGQMQSVATDSNITSEKRDGSKVVDNENPVAAPDVNIILSEVESIIKNLDVGETALNLLRKKLFEVLSVKNNSEMLEEGHREMDALKAKLLELEQENTALASRQQFQSNEISHMAKETIARLSELIKEKDLEMGALAQKNESLAALLENERVDVNAKTDELMRLQGERNELIKTVRQKHEENLHYHAEIQRLNALLNQELKRSEESLQQQKGLELQFEDKQKTLLNTQNELISVKQRLEKLEALAQNGESFQTGTGVQKTLADLESELAKKDEIIKCNCEMLMSCENVIQTKDQELAQLLSHISQLQAQVEKSLQEPTLAKNTKVGDLDSELTSVSDALQEERTNRKYLEQEVQELKEKKSALQKELERLRLHLVGVEEHYTEEALKTEALVKDLKQQILNAEERIKNSSTAYTSVSIRANQQVETLQEQVRLISQQRDDIQQKLSSAEDQMEKQAAALFNLQAVLKQFQRDKEREIMSETDRLRQQLQASHVKETELATEIKVLQGRLLEAKEGLSAAAGLGEQLDQKTNLVAALKEESTGFNEHMPAPVSYLQVVISARHIPATNPARSLVKNLVLGYLLAPANRRMEVLRVVATVLDFSEEERTRAGLSPGVGSGKSSWLQGLLHPGGELHQSPSLSEAFIKFLENESQPQPQLRLLPERKISQASEVGKTDGSVAQSRPAPLLLHDVQLPSFSQFPISRNSSSILKDVLKDS